MLQGARLSAVSGPAFNGEVLSVKGAAWLDQGFTATGGGGRRAVVSLAGARVGGQLSCTGRSAVRPADRPALDLSQARVGSLLLSTAFGTTLNVDGLTYAEAPVLLTGNPPARVSEARQAAEWRVLLARSAGTPAHGTLAWLGKALHLARATHRPVPDTVPFPRLAPPPAGTAP